MAADRYDTVWKADSFQSAAVLKCILSDHFQLTAQTYIWQGATAGKSITSHTFYCLRQDNGCQPCIIFKRIIPYALYDITIQFFRDLYDCLRSRISCQLTIRSVQDAICKIRFIRFLCLRSSCTCYSLCFDFFLSNGNFLDIVFQIIILMVEHNFIDMIQNYFFTSPFALFICGNAFLQFIPCHIIKCHRYTWYSVSASILHFAKNHSCRIHQQFRRERNLIAFSICVCIGIFHTMYGYVGAACKCIASDLNDIFSDPDLFHNAAAIKSIISDLRQGIRQNHFFQIITATQHMIRQLSNTFRYLHLYQTFTARKDTAVMISTVVSYRTVYNSCRIIDLSEALTVCKTFIP